MGNLFQHRIQNYIERLMPENEDRPKAVLVCMLYFLDMDPKAPSWANCALECLGYNCNPNKLQNAIKLVFKMATSKIKIKGTKVIPVPLYEYLDGRDSRDYVARVEPSPIGGRKLAKGLLETIFMEEGIQSQ